MIRKTIICEKFPVNFAQKGKFQAILDIVVQMSVSENEMRAVSSMLHGSKTLFNCTAYKAYLLLMSWE
jgi:hypothetical protein